MLTTTSDLQGAHTHTVTNKSYLVVLVRIFTTSIWDPEAGRSLEFEGSLVYIASFQLGRLHSEILLIQVLKKETR